MTGYTDHDRATDRRRDRLLRRKPASAPARRATRSAWRSIPSMSRARCLPSGSARRISRPGSMTTRRSRRFWSTGASRRDFALLRTRHDRQDHAPRPALRRRTGKHGPHARPAQRALCQPHLRCRTWRRPLQVCGSTSRGFRQSAAVGSQVDAVRLRRSGTRTFSRRLVLAWGPDLDLGSPCRAAASGSTSIAWTRPG